MHYDHRWHAAWIGSVLFALIFGCGAPQPPPDSQVDAKATYQREQVGAPLTDEECAAFGKALQDTIEAGNVSVANNFFDWDAFFETVTADVPVADKMRRSFESGAKSNNVGPTGLIATIIKTVGDEGSYRFLGVRRTDKRPTILFRILANDGALNYHELALIRGQDGEVRCIDIYVYVSGEPLSQTMRSFYIATAAHENRGLVDKLSGRESEFVKSLATFQRMSAAVRERRFADCLADYHRLPTEMQKEKIAQISRLQAASQLGGSEYLKAINDFQLTFDNDRSMHLLAIDGFLLNKQYDRARASIRQLGDAIGGDPYLHILAAGTYQMQGNLSEARREAQAAIEEEPTLLPAYWKLADISLLEKNFRELLSTLRTIESEFGVPFGDLSEVPEYAEFVKSPEYQEWLTRHSSKNLESSASIKDRVLHIVAEQLGLRKLQVTPQASFAGDLKADELDFVELVMTFEEEFGISIPDDAAVKIQTVGQAIEFIEKAKSSGKR